MSGNLSRRLGEQEARAGFDLPSDDDCDHDDRDHLNATSGCGGGGLDIAAAAEASIFEDRRQEALAHVRGEAPPERAPRAEAPRRRARKAAAAAGVRLDASALGALVAGGARAAATQQQGGGATSPAPAPAPAPDRAPARAQALDASSFGALMQQHAAGREAEASSLAGGVDGLSVRDDGVVGGSVSTMDALQAMSKQLEVVAREVVPASNSLGAAGSPCCGGRPPVALLWLPDTNEEPAAVADALEMMLAQRCCGEKARADAGRLPPLYVGVVRPPARFYRQLGRDAQAWADPGCPMVADGDPCAQGVPMDQLTALAELNESVHKAKQAVDKLAEGGIWPERTLLAGAGQGGAVAVHVAATRDADTKLGGALSFGAGGVPFASALAPKVTDVARARPVLLASGAVGAQADAARRADESAELLAGAGLPVRTQTFEGAGSKGMSGALIDALLRCLREWCAEAQSDSVGPQALLEGAGAPCASERVAAAWEKSQGGARAAPRNAAERRAAAAARRAEAEAARQREAAAVRAEAVVKPLPSPQPMRRYVAVPLKAPTVAAPSESERAAAWTAGDAAIDAALDSGEVSDELAAIEAEMGRMQEERKALFRCAKGAEKQAYSKAFSARMRELSARKAECQRMLRK